MVDQPLSTQRYAFRPKTDESTLCRRLRELVRRWPRFGYRRLTALLKREGWPLNAKSAEYLIGLGQVPHPEHGVCMRENNWEYTLDCSAGNGNFYAAMEGQAYLSYWEMGLGVCGDGTEVPEWRAQRVAIARPAARAVTELGVYYSHSGEDS